MYLGVQYVSEISTFDGAGFVPGILDGDESQLKYRMNIIKPHQEKPDNHSWLLWKRILGKLTTTIKATANKLRQQFVCVFTK